MMMQCEAVLEKICTILEVNYLLLPLAEEIVQDGELGSFIPKITLHV